MQDNELRNNIIKMYNCNRDLINNEVNRLGSFEQRSTDYRRNGMLNFGARQMFAIITQDYYNIGGGGPPIVGS